MPVSTIKMAMAPRYARMISNIFHPWAMLVPTTAMTACHVYKEPIECTKWTVLALLPAFVFPFFYTLLRARAQSNGGIHQKVSRSLVRDDPGQLLILTLLFGAPAILILLVLNSAPDLPIMFTGFTAVMLATALVNLRYRASFHISMITSMQVALLFVYGPIGLVFIPLLPIIGLSRFKLGEHTLKQILAGLTIGIVVSGVVFLILGLGQ
ncbi:hypothetical protein DEALK_06660 [Dehalogenimonas alkenigignens]|uniref:PAP2 superfamily n=2 Tax=Dehalogenimonas alkenigignens TaxID=1217799 RepID=A0A0W0GH14_9CHLR|nr:hypothetical protein DEALK_06660 [Dehalogenimonas alkenigignens]